jgi:hypothetical protein
MSPLAMMRSRQRGGCSDAVGIDSICGPSSSSVAMKSFDYEHSDDEGDAPSTDPSEQHIRINVPVEVADDDNDFRDPEFVFFSRFMMTVCGFRVSFEMFSDSQSPTIADICRALQTDSHTFRDTLAERIESKDKHRKGCLLLLLLLIVVLFELLQSSDADSKPWTSQKPMSSILLSVGRLTNGQSMVCSSIRIKMFEFIA